MTTTHKKRLNFPLSSLALTSMLFTLPFAGRMTAHASEPESLPLSNLQKSLSAHFAQGFMPPGEGAPEETTTAGSRRDMWCDGDRAPIRSLMPTQNYGLTLAAQPTVFLEIPQTVASSVLLVVQNEAGDHNAEAILPIPDADEYGVVSFQLPEGAAPLEIGPNYRWSLAVMCDGYLDPSDPFFSGWVQRVEQTPEITQTLARLSDSEQLEWLGQNGYWYDMVSLILQL